MSNTIAVNEFNDIYIDGNGNLAMVEGLESVKQSIEHAVKTQLGEEIFQINRGLPNFQTVWNGTPNLLQFEAALYAIIESVSGVIRITSLDSTVDSKNDLFYTAEVMTEYGALFLAEKQNT